MHLSRHTLGTALSLAATVSAAPLDTEVCDTEAKIARRAPNYQSNSDRASAVKEAFDFAWNGYVDHAFPHDSLKPVSNSYQDDRNGWGASAVDAFTTALIMENQDAVDKILDHIQGIDFSHSDTDVSVFETTIRYMGAMLAGYDLLKGPQSHLSSNDTQIDRVLAQAKNLADSLKVAFDTPTGIPDNMLSLTTSPGTRSGSESSGTANFGTLVLEWQRLSDLTGDSSYGQLAQRAQSYLLAPKPSYNEPWPGLIGSSFSISNGSSLDAHGAWTGGTDSFYEYLLKIYMYNEDDFQQYLDRWQLAAHSSIDHLASHPSTRPDLTFLADYDNQTLSTYSEHLACFDGGNFILGGLTLNDQNLVNFGLALTASCHETYNATTTHIGPDSFNWVDSKQAGSSTAASPPSDQSDFYQENGFWINGAGYLLRPEVIESYYYAYRATGDSKYQDWAWDAFVAINATCRVGSGFSSLNNVMDASQGYGDDQESFFFAEVMKYSYMIHAEDADWQVKADHTNKFIFNTEAHPMMVANGRQV